jgi:hypothetical protein
VGNSSGDENRILVAERARTGTMGWRFSSCHVSFLRQVTVFQLLADGPEKASV